MAKGDGAIDVFSDLWSIYLPAQWERYVVPGIVKVNSNPYLGTEGLFIPGYVQDELGLTRIEQLADPEMSMHFDTDGDGKGEMWTGAPRLAERRRVGGEGEVHGLRPITGRRPRSRPG